MDVHDHVGLAPTEPDAEHAVALYPHPQPQLPVPLEEFTEDLEMRLGRANGNIYHRREGIAGVHDGQVMVRLKKKRFIIIDYSIVPTEEDLGVAGLEGHLVHHRHVPLAELKTHVDSIEPAPLSPPSDPSQGLLALACPNNLAAEALLRNNSKNTGVLIFLCSCSGKLVLLLKNLFKTYFLNKFIVFL